MPNNLYSRNFDSLTGAVYFVVGRGTEGGSASYQLSVAGVSRSEWGQLKAVAQNSGYSLGAIQVDLGQRGTWPLGATEGRSLREGEMTYVDATIAESSSYAGRRGLPYTSDHNQLSTDLLTHGNGQRGRTSITFIDTDTRDSINAWAGSPEGQQWIHRNIDYAQVRNATQTAVDLLDKHPHNISDDQKFEAVCVLAKTANQFPGFLDDYERVLRDGGNYDDIVRKAEELHARNNVYAGNKARLIAEDYVSNYEDPIKQAAMDSAHAKVGNPNFNPSSERGDLDIQIALSAIGQRSHVDPAVWRLQENMNELGIPDAKGSRLDPNGTFDKPTQQAVATFHRQLGMPANSAVTANTLKAAEFYAGAPEILRKPLQPVQESSLPEPLRDPRHHIPPGAPPSYRNDWLERDAQGLPNYLHTRPASELSQTVTPQPSPHVHERSTSASISAPHHETDLHIGARSAAMSAPGRNRPERESEPEPPQPHSQRDAQAFPTGHRDYALFEAIRRQLPNEYSDDMAAHATLEAKRGGITRPDQIKGMAIENGQLTVMGKSGMDFAFVELTASAPPLPETLQQSAAFDRQHAIQLAQFQEQQQQMNMGRGPSMTL